MAHRALRVIATAVLAAGALTACTTEPAPNGTTGGAGKGSSDGKLVIGFAQVGAESGWRTANTRSVREAAEKAGITLKFSDAQQKQENQIKAIRTFIQQKVDVIAFSPVVES
ncbi:substrate-binding domain-containing protein, partial [Streptomyces roseolus]